MKRSQNNNDEVIVIISSKTLLIFYLILSVCIVFFTVALVMPFYDRYQAVIDRGTDMYRAETDILIKEKTGQK